MNEKRNDRQQGGTGRDGGMNKDPQQQGGRQGRDDLEQDRSRTGQVGGGAAKEDTARQGQRGQEQKKGGIGQQKPGRDMDEDVE